jgi:hypothetical protein
MSEDYYAKIFEAAALKGRGLLNLNVALENEEFSGFKLVKTFVMERASEVTEKIYMWQPTGGALPGALVRVSVAEMKDSSTAKNRLWRELKQSMRPQIAPGIGRLAAIGDINFVGNEPESEQAGGITFVRGNVCVTVRNAGDRPIDLSQFAKELDERLGPVLTPRTLGAKQVRPHEDRTLAMEADKTVTVIEAVDPARGWVKVVVPDGELRKEGNSVVYKADTSGAKQVQIYGGKGEN